MRSLLFRSALLTAFVLLLPAAAALAAAPITGTVTNGTNGKVSAGDQVTLIQLQQSMQESTQTTTDAHGHFTLQVPDDGMHLVRVTHQKANYFTPVQPGTNSVAVTVYDAAPSVEGVHVGVEELHVEATSNELHVVEVLQVLNESTPQRTQFGPKGFEFYLPPGSLIGRTGAVTQGGMPVQTPAVPVGDPGHFTFLFPIRPGETQFGIAYTVPYTGSLTFTPRFTGPVKTFAVLLPTTMTLKPGAGTRLSATPAKGGTQTFLAQDVQPGQAPQFTISGSGSLPPQQSADDSGSQGGPNAATANPSGNGDAPAPAVSNSDLAGGRGLNNPLDATGDRDPWAKYKWWILSGLALLLAGTAGVLLRKPSGSLPGAPPVPAPAQSNWPPPAAARSMHHAGSRSHEAVLAALKEEMFALETERLQRRIPEPEYAQAKAALELILSRVLMRDAPGPAEAPTAEPALTGRPGA